MDFEVTMNQCSTDMFYIPTACSKHCFVKQNIPARDFIVDRQTEDEIDSVATDLNTISEAAVIVFVNLLFLYLSLYMYSKSTNSPVYYVLKYNTILLV